MDILSQITENTRPFFYILPDTTDYKTEGEVAVYTSKDMSLSIISAASLDQKRAYWVELRYLYIGGNTWESDTSGVLNKAPLPVEKSKNDL